MKCVRKRVKMAENDPQLPKEESVLEIVIHNYWLPEWYNAKIKNYIYNLKNFDSFCKDVLQMELSETTKNMMKDFLIVDIIVSTMFLAESFAAIAEACSTNPKNIQKYMKEFKATNFYSKISSRDDEYYAKILAIPQIDFIVKDKREEILEAIKSFKEDLNEIKAYYTAHLDLFNSYKHGFRLFPIQSIERDDTVANAIMYFSQHHKQNEVIVICMDKNPHKHQELASKILSFIRVILKNHESKLKNPEEWNVIIPTKSTINEGIK